MNKIKEYQIYSKHIYEFDFTRPIHLEKRHNSPFYDIRSVRQLNEYYIDKYKQDDINAILVIINKIRLKNNLFFDLNSNKLPNMPDKVIIVKHSDGKVTIKLSNNLNNKDIQTLIPIIRNINSWSFDAINNTILLNNINIMDLYHLVEYLIPNDFGITDLEINKLKNHIYRFVLGTDNIEEEMLKSILMNDYTQAMQYLDEHLKLLPIFIDIVYFENNDPRYFEVLHEKINDVIVDDEKLKLYSDEDIKKIYYVLAQLIISNTEIYNTRQGKLAVLEYLFKADDYLDSKQLRNRIAYDIMGYGLGQTPGFEINYDAETVLNLLNFIEQLRR